MKRQSFLTHIFSFLLWAVFLSLGLSACLEEDASCASDSYDTVRVGFLKLDRNPESPRADTLFVQSVFTDRGDLILANVITNGLALPLNPAAGEVSFIINWAEDTASAFLRDTLSLTYNREQRLVSPECGVEQRYNELEIMSAGFDSVNILEPEITLFQPANVRVYTCQYEFTDRVRTRFRRIDTVEINGNITTREVRDTLVVRRITDSFGNTILDQQDTLTAVSLPVNTDAASTTFFFDVLDEEGNMISRFVDLSYFVDTIRIFDCRPQLRVFNLDVDPEDFDFENVDVTEELLNQNNPTNLEIFF
jgi:hypothetical protein